MATLNMMEALGEVGRSAPQRKPSGVRVRYLTPEGLRQTRQLLEQIRSDGQLHATDVKDLLEDAEYARTLSEECYIDPGRKFGTKLDLCTYFTEVFDANFLEKYRKNPQSSGLWTWLALSYYPQFAKTKNGVVQLTANSRWIFNAENFQDGRRHLIAGNVYLSLDLTDAGIEAKEMFLAAGPVTQFNAITDIMTHVQSGVQAPAVLEVAGKLYYDPKASSKIKRGATTADKPGAARQLMRVVRQLAETWDFYDVGNAGLLWEKLPKQFDEYKKDAKV